MLGNQNPKSMPSCSKAPRGLFVLLQVDGIFTVIAISPSSSLRQFPSRYAFDAGQNLPVKEFRWSIPLTMYHIFTPTLRRGHGVWYLRVLRCLCQSLPCWLLQINEAFQHIAMYFRNHFCITAEWGSSLLFTKIIFYNRSSPSVISNGNYRTLERL